MDLAEGTTGGPQLPAARRSGRLGPPARRRGGIGCPNVHWALFQALRPDDTAADARRDETAGVRRSTSDRNIIAPAFLSLTVVALVGLGALASRMRGFGRPAFFVAFAAAVLLTTHTVYPSVGLDIAGPPSQVNRVLATRPLGLVAELPWPGCPGLGCLFTEPRG